METSDLKIKGAYETLDELCKAHPAGEDGDAYIVELNAPHVRCLYKWSKFLNKWVNYGLSEEDKIKENLKREREKSEMDAKSRLTAEVMRFCRNKYGTPYPGEIECGKITWLNVPVFAMSFFAKSSCHVMKSIPYLDMAEEKNRIRKMMDEHDEKYPKLNGEKVNLPHPGLSDEKKEKYFAKYPGLIELVESIEEWRNESIRLREELSAINDLKPLNSEQLKLLGINFNPYYRDK